MESLWTLDGKFEKQAIAMMFGKSTNQNTNDIQVDTV